MWAPGGAASASGRGCWLADPSFHSDQLRVNTMKAVNKKVNKSSRKKIFKERVSLFEHLSLVNPYFNGLYVACKVQFTLFMVYLLARDSIKTGSFHVDLKMDKLLLGGLRDWLVFSAVECVQLLGFLLMYIIFLIWIGLQKWLGKIAHLLYFTGFVAYVCSTFYFVWIAVHTSGIASLPRLIAFIEQVRLVMKSYAFIRENVPKVLYPWHKDDETGPAVWYGGQMSPQVGSFSQYVYFLFAPTLLYRDHYPRNKGPVSWSNVLCYAVQFFGAYVVTRVMFTEVQFPVSMRLADLMYSSVVTLLCAPFMFFLACILVFNSWFNLTAELTRFADREFYQNWWSAVGYSEFYRLWNIPIYDFLSSYIYQELCPWVPYRPLAALPALILSSCLHDFFAGISMGFFAPVFIILFATIGGIVLVSGVKFSKFMTFMFTCTGAFLFESFYYVEVAARYYCPQDTSSLLKFRTPFCFHKYNNITLLF